ncbi:MAG: transcription initiation factor IIB family protein [Halodesulfurarchaeum sp.]
MTQEYQTERQGNDEAVGVGAREDARCEECGGRLVSDETRGETRCGECGLVVDEQRVDPGPEWRAFTPEERDDRRRVGPPSTQLMHDRGLSTVIDWRNADTSGRTLSARKRSQMNRLRRLNRTAEANPSKARTLQPGLREISRMGSALGLPEHVRETAGVVFRRALEEDLVRGRSIEGVATAAVCVAARQAGVPRSAAELETVSRVERKEFQRTLRYLDRELGLDVRPAKPAQYLDRFVSALDLSSETARCARRLIEIAESEGLHSGKKPTSLAAAAIYAAGVLTNEKVTQDEVSEIASVTAVTVRKRYPELVEAAAARDGDHPCAGGPSA